MERFANVRQLPAAQLDAVRSKWSDAMEAAERASAMGKMLTADEKAPGVLADEARQQLEQVLPNYSARNRRIMNLEGVRQAAKGRVDVPARALETGAALYAPSAWRLLARLARIPAVSGAGAIAADALGGAMRSTPLAEITRAALLSQLAGSQ